MKDTLFPALLDPPHREALRFENDSLSYERLRNGAARIAKAATGSDSTNEALFEESLRIPAGSRPGASASHGVTTGVLDVNRIFVYSLASAALVVFADTSTTRSERNCVSIVTCRPTRTRHSTVAEAYATVMSPGRARTTSDG